ncbi:acylphosphatase [Shumkonia mesophila]|uniref:acylphosphatase n=1 Tax=Shumkonia mesophila TaxID=2838854 RepID=UPI002934E3FA|nr:acylphosphatase [Shumkonia mesophila]
MGKPETRTKTVHAIIRGRVQGVWYRSWTVQEATRRGLSGWVRNRADGTVEALFSGPAGQVEDMLATCREGPPAAWVDNILTDNAVSPPTPGFRQLPTV